MATVSTAGCGGRSTITTRRPRRRAATSFASAAVPPEFFVTTVSTRCRREQRHLVVDVERAAVEHDLGVREDGVERFDGPHEEPPPRGAGKGLQALATEGEEDALGTQGRERFGGGRERRGVVPAVAHERRPWWAEQPAVGDAGAGRGLGGVERHDGGEGVGGVDELLDRLVGQVAGEAVGAAEAAPPHLAGPLDRVARQPGQRAGDVVALGRQPAGQLGGLGRAREDQHPSHGCQGRRAIPGPGAFQAWAGSVVRSAAGHREHRCESGAVQQLSPGSDPSHRGHDLVGVGRPRVSADPGARTPASGTEPVDAGRRHTMSLAT